jgi:NADPH:quinone reductase-like Zn-dependent oxidoreductase
MSTMRAIQIHTYGDANQLHLEQISQPTPQEGEVLVHVHAAGVNALDWKIRSGLMKSVMPSTFPYVPGIELAGVVERVGPNVPTFQPGQAVYGHTSGGAYAEYSLVPAQTLAPKPTSLSFDEAATVPIGATTAWQALFDAGQLQAGHIAFLQALGADEVIDYTQTRVEEKVQDVDLVFDTVGGEGTTSALATLRRGRSLITLAGQPDKEQAQTLGVRTSFFGARLGATADLLNTFAQLIDDGQLRTSIAATFPLSEAWKAHELSQSGHGRGRILLHVA